MARKLRDASLDSKAARAELKPRGKPYYRVIDPGLHIGYRKLRGYQRRPQPAGRWVVRRYIGEQAYKVEILATADDLSDANGTTVLNFWQAVTAARGKVQAGSVSSSNYTVGDAVAEYLEWFDRNRKSAVDSRKRAEAFILPELGRLKVKDLTAERIRGWLDDLADRPARIRSKQSAEAKQHHKAKPHDAESKRKRRSSANRVLTILKAALNRAFREDKVSSDAAWRRVEPFEGVDAARVRYLSIAEAKRLINGSEADFRNLVQVALQTGARYGELTRLRVEDFNSDVGTLAIRTSKSGKPRHVVLTDEGIDLLGRLVAGRPGSEFILTKTDGSSWEASHQARPMLEACTRARIVPPIGFHGLRHTWASLSVMNGMPLLVVAKNLGHVDTRMVEKHYGHLAPSYIADAIRAGAPRFGIKADRKVRSLGAS
jgi:integrase